jgi:hypothetical protein
VLLCRTVLPALIFSPEKTLVDAELLAQELECACGIILPPSARLASEMLGALWTVALVKFHLTHKRLLI